MRVLRTKDMSEVSDYREVERVQAEYRERLAASWGIERGARVLEIGCGQGDMTAILADVVGADGHVTAVDIAGPDYGGPMTLGEANGLLAGSRLGARIAFRLNFDVLAPTVSFGEDSFDCAVLAHSSWYFASADQLAQTFARVRPWAKKLCFAEWDLEPHSLDQMAHFVAVLIQAQVESFKAVSLANIRTPLHKSKVAELLKQTGWNPVVESLVETYPLQDADWEIKASLASSLSEAKELGLPPKYVALLETQLDLLRQLALPHRNHPLSCYSMVLERG